MLDLGPAELLDAAVGPHAGGVVERAVAVGLLLHDHDDGEVVEAQGHVQPPEPGGAGRRPGGRRARPRRRAGCPTTGRGCRPTARGRPRGRRRRRAAFPTTCRPGRSGRRRGWRGPRRPGPHDVVLLHHRGERPLPREVEPEAVLGRVADQPDALQRLLHLDAERARRRGRGGRGRARRSTGSSTAGRRAARWRTRRSRRGSGRRPRPGDEEHVARAVVGVEVARS